MTEVEQVLHEIESFRGFTLLDEVKTSLYHYQPDRIGNLSSRYELKTKAPQSVPFGDDREDIPSLLRDHCNDLEIPYVLQTAVDELFNAVPVIEIDGPRSVGKGSQVRLLKQSLLARGVEVDVAKVSGFIDPNNYDEKEYLDCLTGEQVRQINELHNARLKTAEQKFSTYISIDEARDNMPRSIFNFWSHYSDSDEEFLETLNAVKRYYYDEERGIPGEFSWDKLQLALITKMNNLIGRIDDRTKLAQPRVVITDGGRISRLYGFARYASKFSQKDPYGLSISIPPSWQRYISSNGVTGYDKNITLPLPKKIVVLKAREEILAERAKDDSHKADERSSRISSIMRNTEAYYETALIFQRRFPDRVVFVDAERGISEVAEDVKKVIRDI